EVVCRAGLEYLDVTGPRLGEALQMDADREFRPWFTRGVRECKLAHQRHTVVRHREVEPVEGDEAHGVVGQVSEVGAGCKAGERGLFSGQGHGVTRTNMAAGYGAVQVLIARDRWGRIPSQGLSAATASSSTRPDGAQ